MRTLRGCEPWRTCGGVNPTATGTCLDGALYHAFALADPRSGGHPSARHGETGDGLPLRAFQSIPHKKSGEWLEVPVEEAVSGEGRDAS